jgi:hypothetical protein
MVRLSKISKMNPFRSPWLAALITAIFFWSPPLGAIPLWIFSGGTPAAPTGPIAFVAVAVNSFTTTRSPTVILPTCSTNDIVIVTICADTGPVFGGSPPAGWTQIGSSVADTSLDQISAIYWARVDGTTIVSGSSTPWTNILNSNESGLSAAIAFSGCKTSGSPINASGSIGGGAATASDGPSITPTVNNCMIVGIRTIDPGAATRTFTWDAPFTLRLGYSTTPSGVNGTTAGIYIGTNLQTTAAAISPAGDFDATEASSRFSIALSPP